MEEKFIEAEEKGCPAAAAIVEPIQAEGGEIDTCLYVHYTLVLFVCMLHNCVDLPGDRHASPVFFRGLQALCKKVRYDQ